MTTSEIWVYGATGHTGRFVVAELVRRGLSPVLSGRDPQRLDHLGRSYPDLRRHPLALSNPAELSHALANADVVINCAGPFLDTATPLAGASVAAGAHYLDLAAEQASTQKLYDDLHAPAIAAGISVVPAMAFYGGLADLLVTGALAETPLDGVDGVAGVVEEVTVATWLNHWWPTEGTRETGRRNNVDRLVLRDGRFAALPQPPATRLWDFPAPVGSRPVMPVPLTEVVTIARHLPVQTMHSYLASDAVTELADADTPSPRAIDESGRSAQEFVVDVEVQREELTIRATASGQDIYAVSGPLIVEAALRLLAGEATPGALAPGAAYEPREFLQALAPGITVSWERPVPN